MVKSGFKIWYVGSNNALGHTDKITYHVLNKSGSLIFTSSVDCTVKAYDTKLGSVLKTYKGHSQQINQIALGFNESVLYSVSDDNSMIAYDIESCDIINT